MSGVTLTGFLLARIAEDEAVAKAASPGPWFTVAPHGWDDQPDLVGRLVSTDADWQRYGEYLTPAGGEHGDEGLLATNAEHVARHDPAHVLAECEAKRRIVEIHRIDVIQTIAYGGADGPVYVEPDSFEDITTRRWACTICNSLGDEGPCDTLRLLALPYADHPDYRDEWRS